MNATTTATTTCSRRAWRAITGEVGYATHNMYNYRLYYNQVLQQDASPRIAVLRTEHLAEDWRRIEKDVLQGSNDPFGDDNFQFPQKHASKKKRKDYYLSESSQKVICSALCQEIQVYKQILARAVNLNKDDYAESMQELQQHCPEEASLSSCPT
jgi:RecB family exonuclease